MFRHLLLLLGLFYTEGTIELLQKTLALPGWGIAIAGQFYCFGLTLIYLFLELLPSGVLFGGERFLLAGAESVASLGNVGCFTSTILLWDVHIIFIVIPISIVSL